MLPAGCHTHDVDPKYPAFSTSARRDADGRGTPDDPLFNAQHAEGGLAQGARQ